MRPMMLFWRLVHCGIIAASLSLTASVHAQEPIPSAAEARPSAGTTGLSSTDASVQIQAAEALGQKGDPAAFDVLITALTHTTDEAVQAAILGALEKLSYQPAQLIGTLEGHELAIARAYAAFTLGRMRATAALDALVTAVQDPDAKVREQAIIALGALGDLRGFEALIKAAHRDPNPTLRALAEAQATRLAGASQGGFDEDSAVAQLKHPDPARRREAADMLGKKGSWWAVDPLIEALDDPDTQVRERAAAALGELKDKRASRALESRFPQRTGKERYLMMASIAIIGDTSAREVLEPYVLDEDGYTRKTAVRGLARLADARSAPALAAAWAKEPLPENRQEIARALGLMHTEAATATLSLALSDQERTSVRCEAARALAKTPGTPALEALGEALSVKEPLVRAAAVDALANRDDVIDAPATLSKLEEMARKESDTYVQEAAIEALVVIRGRARRQEAQPQPR